MKIKKKNEIKELIKIKRNLKKCENQIFKNKRIKEKLNEKSRYCENNFKSN